MTTRTDIVQAQLEDGVTLNIRATRLGGEEDVGAFDQTLSLTGVMTTLESIASLLSKTIKKVKPQKATVEFGIELAVEAGQITALLVKGTGAGHLTIMLEWSGNDE